VRPSLSVALPRWRGSTDLFFLEGNVVVSCCGSGLRTRLPAGHFSPAFLPVIPRTEQDNVPSDKARSGTRWPWLFLATFLWALANYAEAFSYLVLNTIWLKSDMEGVVLESGVDRWLWVCLGTFLAVLAARLLLKPARRAVHNTLRPNRIK
jgi:hypothetical protein